MDAYYTSCHMRTFIIKLSNICGLPLESIKCSWKRN